MSVRGVGEPLEAVATDQKAKEPLGRIDVRKAFHEPELLAQLLDDVLGDVVIGGELGVAMEGRIQGEEALDRAQRVATSQPPVALPITLEAVEQ